MGRPPARAKGKLLAYLHFYAAVAKGWRSKLYFVPPSPQVGSGKAKGDRAFESTDYERFMAGLDRELQRHFPTSRGSFSASSGTGPLSISRRRSMRSSQPSTCPSWWTTPPRAGTSTASSMCGPNWSIRSGDTGLSRPMDYGALCALAGGKSSSRPLTVWLRMCPTGSRGLMNLKGSGLGPTLRCFPSEFEHAI